MSPATLKTQWDVKGNPVSIRGPDSIGQFRNAVELREARPSQFTHFPEPLLEDVETVLPQYRHTLGWFLFLIYSSVSDQEDSGSIIVGLGLSIGPPDSFHALNPPSTEVTFERPILWAVWAASADRPPTAK